ncbi:diguanylate phosphodiesterase [Pantoea cypripedii]|uniref:Diguanylate phosphodiesterase n=1 Tax=Pantoea cypripedii TaxID=55209 RepID=A0A1X1EVC2_PANCY|nr:diguanylate phosphodiesterase [Pantoea cypripedii]MBP2198122.1 EAL domain-containing protein (putative c-di-GMP-specific phosphodiesterase class I) [Pantoea cypripedii]ORM93966.1 diguanylate phosphodiesterase [Pantoea cypripedii]
MLSTVLYRSHLCDHVPVKTLEDMVDKANKKNELSDVTGILLFDGLHFFQLLEGPPEAVQSIYERICKDARHENLVELLHDYAPARRFGNSGMELFDLREHDKATVLQAVLNKGTSKYQLTFEDRALRFLRTFVEAREKENYFEIPPASTWEFIADTEEKVLINVIPDPSTHCHFAFQPIIDPFSREVLALEALIRSADGGPPQKFFAPYSRKQAYEVDLKSKSQAFKLAKQFDIPELTLSINLLPMSLVMVPNAVDYLLTEIRASGLVPEQIVVEVTEDEAISRADEFAAAIKQLKAAGISVALDDFGAGFAGLSLLAKFQPDKIKIDRSIIKDVHKSGPKQAIVHAIIKCCSSLEISVIAEGVEKAEEWMWLEAAGISKFQGFLFARPQLNGIPAVAWPEIQ